MPRLLAFFLALTLPAPSAVAQFWTIETIAEDMGEVDFVIDDLGTLHVLYTTVPVEPERVLHYAWNDGGGWQYEEVTTDIEWSLVSIAVDPGGVPHIAFIDLDSEVQYGVRTGGSWSFDGPPPLMTFDTTHYPSIALDSAGQPHIAYQIYGDRIRHAHKAGGIWTDEEVTTSFTDLSQSRVAMMVGPGDVLHVAGWHTFDGAAFFTDDGTGWTQENFGQWGYMPRAKLDAAGDAHFTYYGPGAHYATNKTGSWVIDPIDPEGFTEDNDIALDQNGVPAITYTVPVGLYYQAPDFYYDATTYFAYKMNGTWYSEVVDVAEEFPTYFYGISRLAFDADNIPHILYRDAETDELRHAVRVAATAADPVAAAGRTRVLSAEPNPFNPRTRVSFEVGRESVVRVAIYDAAGRLVRVLSEQARGVGVYSEDWDGRDGAGRAMASGVYFVRVEGGGQVGGMKVVLVR